MARKKSRPGDAGQRVGHGRQRRRAGAGRPRQPARHNNIGEPASKSAVAAAGLPLWVASFTLQIFGVSLFSALTDDRWKDCALAISAAEIFAGVAAVIAAVHQLTPKLGHAIDVTIDRLRHDLLTRQGFLLALAAVLALPPGGLLILAPPCSSFVFANSSRTKRKRHNFAGDQRYSPVKEGNQLAETSIFLLAVALAKGVFVALENPAGSSIFSFLEYWAALLPGGVDHIMHRCAYSTAPLGSRAFKPFKFKAYGPTPLQGNWLTPAVKKCPCGKAGHLELMEVDKHGKVSGTANLAKSGQYPPNLGIAIVRAWQRAGRIVDQHDSNLEEETYSESEAESEDVADSSSASSQMSDDAESSSSDLQDSLPFEPGTWAT